MVMERLPVYVRLRPTESEHSVRSVDNGLLIENQQHFPVAAVLTNSSQEETFKVVGLPLVKATLKGVSSTLLAYGGAGSGKTYSLVGGEQNHETGIIVRALEMLVHQRSNAEINVSMYEVTSTDQLFDLLRSGKPGEVAVGGNLRGVSSLRLESIETVQKIVKISQVNRSPNSHQITSVQVLRRDEAAGEIVQSKLLLVDLVSAGSCSPVSRQLSLLEHVVVALSSRSKNIRVPFRQCRLTHALQGALGEKSNTSLLCTIRPDASYMQETLASLRFASRAAKIPITHNVNSAPDPFLKARELKREVDALKRELSIQSLLTGGRSTVGIEPLNANQIQEAKRQVDDFLNGGAHPDIVSNRQLHAVFNAFRQSIAKSDLKVSDEKVTSGGKMRGGKKNGPMRGSRTELDEKIEATSGNKSARKQKDENEKKNNKESRGDKKDIERKSSKQSTHTPNQTESITLDLTEKLNEAQAEQNYEPPDRDTAYKMFREGEGREIVKLLRDAESCAIEKEHAAQREALCCNEKIKKRNEIKKSTFGSELPDGRKFIDEDELEKLKELKRLKAEIISASESYDIHKRQAEYCRQQAQKAAERVIFEFNQWEARNFQ